MTFRDPKERMNIPVEGLPAPVEFDPTSELAAPKFGGGAVTIKFLPEDQEAAIALMAEKQEKRSDLFDGDPREVYEKDVDATRNFWGKLIAAKGEESAIQTYQEMLERISPEDEHSRFDYAFSVYDLPQDAQAQNELLSATRMLALTQKAVIGTFEVYQREMDHPRTFADSTIMRPIEQIMQSGFIGEKRINTRKY